MIGWTLSLLSILGVLMNLNKNKWGFVVLSATSIGWLAFDVNIGLYEQIPIWCVFLVITLYGFYKWGKEEMKT